MEQKTEITTIWKTGNKDSWIQKYHSLWTLTGVLAMGNMAYGVYKDEAVVILVNGLIMAAWVLVWLSWLQHKKEEKTHGQNN